MKKFLIALLSFVMLATLSMFVACEETDDSGSTHSHSGGIATCTEKAICAECGEEYGELNAENHASAEYVYQANNNGTHKKLHKCCDAVAVESENCSGGTATCETKAVCEFCSAQYGELGAHSGGIATCKQKAVCTDCGIEYGELNAENHASAEYVYQANNNGTHKKLHKCCNVVVVEAENCFGGTATCEAKAVCEFCSAQYGELGAHSGGIATCTGKAICVDCGNEYGELNAENHASDEYVYQANNNGTHKKLHKCCNVVVVEAENCSGGTATCKDKAVCELCNTAYGETDSHVYTKQNYDDNNHWKECAGCGTKDESSIAKHEVSEWETTDDGKIGKCSCGKVLTTVVEKVAATDLNLYAVAELNGTSFTNSVTYAPEVSVNGNIVPVNVTIVNGEIAEYANDAITAKKVGETVVNVTYELLGESKSLSFEVKVERSVADYTTTVTYFSAMDGTHAVITELFGTDAITEAVQIYKGTSYDLTWSEGKLTGIFTENKIYTGCELDLYTDNYGYKLKDVKAYTKVINDYTDFEDMRLTAERKTVEGYFIMNADIDLWNIDLNGNGTKCSADGTDTFYPYNGGSDKMLTAVNDSTRVETAAGFIGVFDGNGHKISGFRAGNSYGFFGTLCGKRDTSGIDYTIVKNVAFENTHIFWTSWTKGNMFAKYAAYTIIENVYVQFKYDNFGAADNKNFSLFGCSDSAYTQINNVILNYDRTLETDTFSSSSGSAVGIFAGAGTTNYYVTNTGSFAHMMKGVVKGLYVIAPKAENGRVMPLIQHGNYSQVDGKWVANGSFSVYAINDFADIGEKQSASFDELTHNPVAAESGADYVFHWQNAYRYDTLKDMVDAGNTNIGKWVVTESGVSWKW